MASAEGKGIAAWVRNIPEFVNQVKTETGKVSWPSWKETYTTAIMVVIMTVLLGLFFFGVDQAFSRTVQFLLSLLG